MIVMEESKYYQVAADMKGVPVNDYLMHGYEDKWVFYDAVQKLLRRWKSRIGECIGERNGFLRLRFHDTPGDMPDEEWLPRYLLTPTLPPDPPQEETTTEKAELEEAFEFD